MTEIFAANGWLNTAISQINNVLWTYILVAVLIACAILFTIKTRGVQFRMMGEMIRLLGDSTKKSHEKHVSSFEAFAVSIASRVGTGNLAGVATAIAVRHLLDVGHRAVRVGNRVRGVDLGPTL